MKLMSDEGVSTIAVVEEDGRLLSAVSVSDVGKVRREHMYMALKQAD